MPTSLSRSAADPRPKWPSSTLSKCIVTKTRVSSKRSPRFSRCAPFAGLTSTVVTEYAIFAQVLYNKDCISDQAIIYWHQKGSKPQGRQHFLKATALVLSPRKFGLSRCCRLCHDEHAGRFAPFFDAFSAAQEGRKGRRIRRYGVIIYPWTVGVVVESRSVQGYSCQRTSRTPDDVWSVFVCLLK